MEMDRLFAAPGRETTDVAETSSNDQREYSNSNTELSLFADKSYEQFMEKLDSSTNYSSRKRKFRLKVESEVLLTNQCKEEEHYHHFSHRKNNEDDQVNCSTWWKILCRSN
ncbi:hypothetical protein NC652_035590 [Populus alba x Populus x berolinensis]|nr:hypothetical protein NC652_035590 [Populus alba x Populus x berolinensis]